MADYSDIAAMFEKIATEHETETIAELLVTRNDPEHADSNQTLAQAERTHADACKRAAMALRGR